MRTGYVFLGACGGAAPGSRADMADPDPSGDEIFVLDDAFGLIGRLDGLHIAPDGDAWAMVHCGTFGAKRRLVPLRGAQWWSGYVRVACSRQKVRSAPFVGEETLLGPDEAERLRDHYAEEPYGAERRFFREGW